MCTATLGRAILPPVMGSRVSLEELVAANLPQLRRERGLSQHALASRAAEAGLNWNRLTVAGIETRRRGLSVGEWLLLPAILRCSSARLVNFDMKSVDEVEIEGVLLTPAQFGRLVLGVGSYSQVPIPEEFPSYAGPSIHEEFEEFITRETNRKVAKRMGWSVRHLVTRSKHLWDGRELAAERERRLEQTGAPSTGASPRVLQALRGHITRELIYELQHPRAPRALLELKGRQRDASPSTRKPSKPAAPSSAH